MSKNDFRSAEKPIIAVEKLKPQDIQVPQKRKQPKQRRTVAILALAAILLIGCVCILFYGQSENEKDILVTVNGKAINRGETITLEPGDKVLISAYPEDEVTAIYYKLGDDKKKKVEGKSSAGFTVPEDIAEGEQTLLVNALYTDELYVDNKKGQDTVSPWYKVNVKLPCQVSIYGEVNGQTMEDGGTYTVKEGDIVTIEASSTEALISFIGYYITPDSDFENRVKVYSSHAEIVLPAGGSGEKKTLYVEPVAENDNGDPNTTTKTGWQKYTLIYE